MQIVRSWAYDVPPAVTYQSEYYAGMQSDMNAANLQQQHELPRMPDHDLQQW